MHSASGMTPYYQTSMLRGGFNAPPSPYGVPQHRPGVPHVHMGLNGGFITPPMLPYIPPRPIPGLPLPPPRSPYNSQSSPLAMPYPLPSTGFRGNQGGPLYGSCSGGNCGYWGGCQGGHCGVFYDFRPCHSAECFDGPVHGFDCFDGYCQRVCNDGICRDFIQRGCSGKNCHDDDEEAGPDEKRSEDKS
ncbi:unnamed protein product [Hymenolepis diminuta]|uniref:Chitin-binding type-1 domain-containing protein n=1 Tax=Hymenolepis diminuta TaxID=6216 RepID=A0A0R3SIG8_HYMDI|nr:unnamed protein product [Hymenolepis diminuta]VUZ46407.1 unnamed protein product [Hymenolepis diminuta]